ncbi:MAG: protein kinase [Planctomycetes bacterium]|nr:protein kinase [Planctomycetota bacterium]
MRPPNDSQRERMRSAFGDAETARDSAPTVRIPPEPIELQPGQIIGKCEIVREIGRGGMGAVYLARHTTLDVPVAVKVLPPLVAYKAPEYAERFLREARLAARIKHPNVLAVMDADQDAATGLYYMVTEFADGGSVGDRLDKGPFPEQKAVAVVAGIAKALQAAAKQGIIHRDIKPDNILISKDGRVKLADLGLAKDVAQEADITKSSSAIGTPFYMSPEQIQDSKRVDIRSDIYSLGATFFHLLTGKPPFPGSDVYGVLHKVMTAPTPDPKASRPEISDGTSRLCMKMMEKDVARRYQTPSDVISDLAKGGAPAQQIEMEPATAAGGVAPVAPPELSAAAPSKSVDLTADMKRGNPMAVMAAIAAAIVLAIIVFANLRGGSPKPGETGSGEVAKEPAADTGPEKVDAPSDSPARPTDKPESPEVRTPPADMPPTRPDPAPPAPRRRLSEGARIALSCEEIVVRGNDRFVRDLTGRTGDGLVRGGVTAVPGHVGRALQFNGATGFLELPAATERTVAMWVRSDLPLQSGWFDGGAQDQPLAAFQIGLFQPNGFQEKALNAYGLFLGFWHLDVAVPCEDLRSGWHHVAVSWDGARAVRIVLDGQPLDGHVVVADLPFDRRAASQPFALPSSPVPGDAPTLVGRIRGKWWNEGSEFFRGALDEVAVWDRALTLEEMTDLHRFAGDGKSYCDAIAAEIAADVAAATPEPPADTPEPPVDAPPDPVEPATPDLTGKLAAGCVMAMSFEHVTANLRDGTLGDMSGHGHRIKKGKANFRPGRVGQGVQFDGQGDPESQQGAYMELPALRVRTVAAWVKKEGPGPAIWFWAGTNGPIQAFILGFHEAGTFRNWKQRDNGVYLGFWQLDVVIPAPQTHSDWHHLAVSWDGATRVRYAVDGKLMPGGVVSGTDITTERGKLTLPRAPNPDARQSLILGAGRQPGWEAMAPFRGVIDELAIWERELTEEELTSLAGYAAEKKSYCEEIEKQAGGK